MRQTPFQPASTISRDTALSEPHRRAKATAAANKYARRPEGSAFTYGLVAVSLTLLMIVIFGMFYSLKVLSYPVALGSSLVPVFVMGILLQRCRRRLHNDAFDREFANQDDSPPI